VYWNNALHHMPDVSGAVAWSRRVLRSGGVFALDDYVGPNRFQIADAGLAIANEARALLSEAALFAAGAPNRPLPRAITREWLARQIARDPSEATDAAATLEAVARFFPEATVRPTGGLIYFIGLNGLFGTFDESRDEDRALLGSLLLLDRTLVADRPDRTLYACAVAALPS
jgi:SAM-dependent methyltransferase